MLPFLEKTPRDYQEECIEKALTTNEQRTMFELATGSGKTLIEEHVKHRVGSKCWIVTPIVENIPKMLMDHGVMPKIGKTMEPMMRQAWELQISTPTRLRNRLRSGKTSPAEVEVLQFDEGHMYREENTVSNDLFTMLPDTKCLSYTATTYCGTPDATENLWKSWPVREKILSYRMGVDRGYLAHPKVSVFPLVDNNKLRLAANGDYDPADSARILREQFDAILDYIATLWMGNHYDMPTCLTVPPNTEICYALVEYLRKFGFKADAITGLTPTSERQKIYEDLREAKTMLVQMKVVGIGWDMPQLGRLVDLQPTTSPSAWVQLLGRLSRIWQDLVKEYVCTNRNLEMHGHVLEGLITPTTIAESQEAFEGMCIGVYDSAVPKKSQLKRFTPFNVPLNGGVTGYGYLLRKWEDEGAKRYIKEIAAYIDPVMKRSMWATRKNRVHYNTTLKKHADISWGNWHQSDVIIAMGGYANQRRKALTSDQLSWWSANANRMGFDAAETPTPHAYHLLQALVTSGSTNASED